MFSNALQQQSSSEQTGAQANGIWMGSKYIQFWLLSHPNLWTELTPCLHNPLNEREWSACECHSNGTQVWVAPDFNPFTNPYIYSNNSPPLGNCQGWPKPQVLGTIGSGLTPRVQIRMWGVRFPALISMGGRRQQVLGGPEPGRPQDSAFGESCWNKGCSACKTGTV